MTLRQVLLVVLTSVTITMLMPTDVEAWRSIAIKLVGLVGGFLVAAETTQNE